MKTVLSALFAPSLCLAGSVVLEPAKDTTLYDDAGGALGNGSGQYLFVGRTNQPPDSIGNPTPERGLRRRTLLRFPLAGAVPVGAKVVEAALELTVSNVPSNPPATSVSLHRVLADWGEGASDATQQEGAGVFPSVGDATWSETFFGETPARTWTLPGGDFIPEPSAQTTVTDKNVRYRWESAGLTRDVSDWLAGAVPNDGWILVGDESAPRTAKRFNSRENGSAAARPSLAIGYLFPTEILASEIRSDGTIEVTFTTVSGQNYAVESGGDLKNWTALPPVAGDGNPMTGLLPAPSTPGRLFVRVTVSD